MYFLKDVTSQAHHFLRIKPTYTSSMLRPRLSSYFIIGSFEIIFYRCCPCLFLHRLLDIIVNNVGRIITKKVAGFQYFTYGVILANISLTDY